METQKPSKVNKSNEQWKYDSRTITRNDKSLSCNDIP